MTWAQAACGDASVRALEIRLRGRAAEPPPQARRSLVRLENNEQLFLHSGS